MGVREKGWRWGVEVEPEWNQIDSGNLSEFLILCTISDSEIQVTHFLSEAGVLGVLML